MRAGGTPRPGRGGAGGFAEWVSLARTTNQSVSATPTNVTWDTVNDQGGFTVSPGDSAIIIPAAGRYQINFNMVMQFLDEVTGTNYVEGTVRVNGAVVLNAPHNAVRLLAPGGAAWAVGADSAILVPCIGVMELALNDSLTFSVLNLPPPAGAFNTVFLGVAAVAGSPGTTLSIQRVG